MLSKIKIIPTMRGFLPTKPPNTSQALFSSSTLTAYIIPSASTVRSSLPPQVREKMTHYPSVINIMLQWGDMDAFGHLNNVTMCRYFETGRRAYFDQILGPYISPERHEAFVDGKGVGPIIKSVLVKYRAQAEYPDMISMGVKVDPAKVGADRFTQEFVAISHASGAVIAEGEAVVVTFDYERQRKAEIPGYILDAFRKGIANVASEA